MPRTGCVCEIGSLKFCAQRSARTTRSSLLFSSLLFSSLLFSKILLERVMMVNPFLVICSLYYTYCQGFFLANFALFRPVLLKTCEFCIFWTVYRFSAGELDEKTTLWRTACVRSGRGNFIIPPSSRCRWWLRRLLLLCRRRRCSMAG